MAKFKCTNKECQNYNKTEFVSDVKYIFDKETQKLEPKNISCPGCGVKMEEVTEKKSLSSINFSHEQQIRASRVYKGNIY